MPAAIHHGRYLHSEMNFAYIKYNIAMDMSKVIQTLDTLPEVFETESLIEKLLFIDKVEKGMKDVAEGRTLSLQEAKQRFEKKWSNAK